MDKTGGGKSMKSKLNMYTDVRNAKVKHSILLDKWVFDRNFAIFIHIYTSCK